MKIRASKVVMIVATATLALTLLAATAGYASAVGHRNSAIVLGGAAAYLFSQDKPGAGLLAATGSAIAWDNYNRERFLYPVRYRRHYIYDPYYPSIYYYDPYPYYGYGWRTNRYRDWDDWSRHRGGSRSFNRDRDRGHRWDRDNFRRHGRDRW